MTDKEFFYVKKEKFLALNLGKGNIQNESREGTLQQFST